MRGRTGRGPCLMGTRGRGAEARASSADWTRDVLRDIEVGLGEGHSKGRERQVGGLLQARRWCPCLPQPPSTGTNAIDKMTFSLGSSSRCRFSFVEMK